MIVVDASLAVKWFRFEQDSDLAEQVYSRHLGGLCAPDLFSIEVGAALVRCANMEKRSRPLMEQAIFQFTAMIDNGTILLARTTPAQLVTATKLAIEMGHPLKDCIYLALAIELGCDLVTCDAKFAANAKGVWDRVRVLGE
jgi:predicted nucleic acid-binding protein